MSNPAIQQIPISSVIPLQSKSFCLCNNAIQTPSDELMSDKINPHPQQTPPTWIFLIKLQIKKTLPVMLGDQPVSEEG